MASLVHQYYTRTIPPHAERFSHKGKPAVSFKNDDGDTVVGFITSEGQRCRVKAAKYYGQYIDAQGVRQRVPLSRNKEVARQMLNKLTDKVERAKGGFTDYTEQLKRPLSDHMKDWKSFILARGKTAKHVNHTLTSCQRILDGCSFTFYADLSASKVQEFGARLRTERALPALDPAKETYTRSELATALGINLPTLSEQLRRHRLPGTGNGKARRYPRETALFLAARRTQGRSIRTANFHLKAIKQFAAWMVKNKRAPETPSTNSRSTATNSTAAAIDARYPTRS